MVIIFSLAPANLSQSYAPLIALNALVEQDTVKKSATKSHHNLVKPSEIECLARNIYHESRGEPELGMIAVGLVTINRLNDSQFPSTICGVVYQSHNPANGDKVCQFSWVCNLDEISKPVGQAWSASVDIAKMLLNGGHIDHADLVSGAKYFHASSIRPVWVRKFTRVTEIGNHVFYR